ncbi:MAG TPA: gamma-glutamyl-gamma-aminobutyrate hydrolase family protein, partial [Solirubrobacteraceae bacterium]|nr:gamma-glutamyl-gamma-aminobutyrate hydrolase family protein [Solirubrobacteraceae bacterium]
MSTLLVDNYDSYTYNVFHLLAAVRGEEPLVVHNDMVSWRALSRWDFDAIVLSPGPGRPERWHDFGVCSDILRCSDIPVLGICLGHQGLGQVLDGMVGSAPMVMHGRLSRVKHVGSGLFDGIAQDFSVVRYHSLAVTGPLGPDGRVTAWTDEGVVMGIEHRRRPLWGVQFHPESIATEAGHRLVENFYALARRHRRPRSASSRPAAPAVAPRPATERARAERRRAREASEMRLEWRTIAGEPDTERLFEELFGEAEQAFWLDSADAPTTLGKRSFMGSTAGAEGCVLEYDVQEGAVKVDRAGERSTEMGSIFDVLDRELAGRAVSADGGPACGLLGGFVGYLGYECKADCGSPNAHRSDVPDAVLMFANRVVAVDHVSGETHVLALWREREEEAREWLARAEAAARALIGAGASGRDLGGGERR